jgi:hypothetical protein
MGKNARLIALLKGLNKLGQAVATGAAAANEKKTQAPPPPGQPNGTSGTPAPDPRAPKKEGCGGCGPK